MHVQPRSDRNGHIVVGGAVMGCVGGENGPSLEYLRGLGPPDRIAGQGCRCPAVSNLPNGIGYGQGQKSRTGFFRLIEHPVQRVQRHQRPRPVVNRDVVTTGRLQAVADRNTAAVAADHGWFQPVVRD